MKAVYARVSTDDQAKYGYSLADQIRLCRKKAENYDIIEYIDDGYSGEFMGRPALDKLLQDLETKPITHVIIYDPDRLARNSELQLSLAAKIESYAKLIFVTYEYDASPEGKLFFTMKAGISAYEKAKILARTSRGRFSKALQGRVPFNCKPFGYDWDAEKCMYTINEAEAETVKLIYKLYLEGDGCPRIATKLNEAGRLTKKGCKWVRKTVDDILRNTTYMGKFHFGKKKYKLIAQGKQKGTPRPQSEWVTIDVPAIISEEDYAKAQKQAKINSTFSKRNTKHFYLLQGIIKCGKCGYGMTPHAMFKGKDYRYYACYNQRTLKGCDAKYTPISIENEVWAIFLERLSEGKLYPQPPIDYQAIVDENNKAIMKLEKQRKDVGKWYKEGIYDSEQAESELRRLSDELEKRKSLVLPREQKKPDISLAEAVAAKSPEEKRRILRKSGVFVSAVERSWHLVIE